MQKKLTIKASKSTEFQCTLSGEGEGRESEERMKQQWSREKL